jgi:hypothetical protein
MPSFITQLNALVKKMHVGCQAIYSKQKEFFFGENASWLLNTFPTYIHSSEGKTPGGC